MLTRRGTLLGALALAGCAPAPLVESVAVASFPPPSDPRFAAIEQRVGGRVGVAAYNTAADAWLGHRLQERFAMCSTFKWALAAAVLDSSESGGIALDQQVRFDENDIVHHSPRVADNLARGSMSVEDLCAATVGVSDNAAANLLLEGLTGPQGFTNWLRANGDSMTRLDRIEPALNQNIPGDERDTTTPEAMARTLHRSLLTDAVLSDASRQRLLGWMAASTTGLRRIRAGLPQGWRAADKTGTGGEPNNATNDVAVIWPPNAEPIVLAVYLSHSTAPPPARDVAHAEIARIVADTWS